MTGTRNQSGSGHRRPVPDSEAEVDHWWSMFIRRFDLEHTFRFLKQSLGWSRPRLRDPQAADRWTWLIIAAHTQLRLARPLAADCRLPWQKPLRHRATDARTGPCRLSQHPPEAGQSRQPAESIPHQPRTPKRAPKRS